MECNGTPMLLQEESFLFHLQEVQQQQARSFLLIRSCNQTCANFVTTEAPNPGLTMADLVEGRST